MLNSAVVNEAVNRQRREALCGRGEVGAALRSITKRAAPNGATWGAQGVGPHKAVAGLHDDRNRAQQRLPWPIPPAVAIVP